eukprot:gb/GECH01000724.1/.p1 GENE.gb/GECH01000724.1/~~gb/GECH01000724.1/.p1  ORF type:complete len:333 (+),score=87.82 gb/GECH01000724.1/:1-999(+)
MNKDEHPKLKIGWIFNKKKRKKFMEPFKEFLNSHNVECISIPIDDSNVHLYPQVDILLHKITDDMSNTKDPESQNRSRNLKKYIELRKPQGMRVVEDYDAVETLLDRNKFNSVLQSISNDSNFDLHIPEYVMIDQNDDVERIINNHQINFPLLCKTSIAVGEAASHQMAVVFSVGQLRQIQNGEDGTGASYPPHERVATPFMAQELINHDGTLNKIYTIRHYTKNIRKPSLKNMDPSLYSAPLLFYSQDPLPSDLRPDPATPLADPPEPERLEQIASALREKLGLDLIGIDLIRDSDSGRLYVIDVNYLPSYQGVDNAFGRILEYFYYLQSS